MTDHNGKTVDFRNVILIMTTNAGASDLAKEAVGFGRTQRSGDDTEAINRMFSPEFRNRLDAIIAFAGFRRNHFKSGRKIHHATGSAIRDRNVSIEISEEARSWIGSKGYDKNFGARPLARIVQEYVKKPLAEELLFGKLTGGGLVSIEFQDGELSFHYENTKATDRSKEKTSKKKAKRTKQLAD